MKKLFIFWTVALLVLLSTASLISCPQPAPAPAPEPAPAPAPEPAPAPAPEPAPAPTPAPTEIHDVAVTNIVAPSQVEQGTTIKVTVVVKNEGNVGETFEVTLKRGTATIGTLSVYGLAAGATKSLTFSWNTANEWCGSNTLKAKVDPVFGEKDGADNTREISVLVQERAEAPSLIHDVKIYGIGFPDEVERGTTVTVTVPVENQGDVSETFNVILRCGTTTISTQTVSNLAAGATKRLTFYWDTTTAVVGTHTLWVTAATVPGETDTADNTFWSAVLVRERAEAPSLIHDVKIYGIGFPDEVDLGTTVTVTVTVENQGDVSETFDVTLKYGTTTIGTQTVSNLAAGATKRLTFYWDTTTAVVGTHTLWVTAATVPGETDTADNTVWSAVLVRERAEAPTRFSLQIVVSPSWGGSVSHSNRTYPRGNILYVTATPARGYRFVSWSGDFQSTKNPITITMNHNYTLQANFKMVLIPGTRISPKSPLYDERFVRGETVRLKATVTCTVPCDGSQLQWTSDLDGYLGNGTVISTSGLSVGTHTITVSGYGGSETFPVRVFAHLGDLYRAPPAEGEIQRILSDFTFVWWNGTGVDEDWSAYDSFNFDQNSTDPSKVVIIAKLDVMRHQRFTEPLPMTGGKTIYEHFRTYVHTIQLQLDCGPNMGGGDRIYLARSASVWVDLGGGTTTDPDACKTPLAAPSLKEYIYGLQLYVHEGRHCEWADPGHSNCGQGGAYSKDERLEGGGGYAWAALYEMWVYKYSLYDPPNTRSLAGQQAAQFLRTRFCTTPSHSDPGVQAIIQELLDQ